MTKVSLLKECAMSGRDPLAGRTGSLVEMVRSLDDHDLAQLIACWDSRRAERQERDDGYGAWWCTKISSAGRNEQRRRQELDG